MPRRSPERAHTTVGACPNFSPPLPHAGQFIESIEAGGAKDYTSCEASIAAYREVFNMDVSGAAGRRPRASAC